MSGRTLAMGDIHGNLDALNQCLDRSKYNPSNDVLIQLGDVSDRHQETARVVELLLELPSLIALRGNHDHWTRQWLNKGIMDEVWLSNGGIETVESYRKLENQIDRDLHKSFFEEIQKNYHVDDDNRVFVHGGFKHPKGPAFENDSSICLWDRSLWFDALNASPNGMPTETIRHFKEIFIGHTPTLNWGLDIPMNAFNVWNLDTGAGTTGKLTVMDIETKEYWQSDKVD